MFGMWRNLLSSLHSDFFSMPSGDFHEIRLHLNIHLIRIGIIATIFQIIKMSGIIAGVEGGVPAGAAGFVWFC